MLKIKNVKQSDAGFYTESSYTPSVQTYNILTEHMSDDCIPIQTECGGCIWLDNEGALGEIEFIYPKTVQGPLLHNVGQSITGTPHFEVTDPIYESPFIQVFEGGFVIWLKEVTHIELGISNGGIIYFISNDELCGILATKTVENE